MPPAAAAAAAASSAFKGARKHHRLLPTICAAPMSAGMTATCSDVRATWLCAKPQSSTMPCTMPAVNPPEAATGQAVGGAVALHHGAVVAFTPHAARQETHCPDEEPGGFRQACLTWPVSIRAEGDVHICCFCCVDGSQFMRPLLSLQAPVAPAKPQR